MVRFAQVENPKGQIINQVATFDRVTTTAVQPRAIGAVSIHMQACPSGQTRLADLRQSGCLKLVIPRSYRRDAEAILVNTAGGITGGDRLSIEAKVGAGAALTLTTQAAERAYRAQPGEIGQLSSKIQIGPKARLNWLPQEMILFDHAALHRRLEIDMASDSSLLLVEPLVLGRAAMKERLGNVDFKDRIAICRNGRPIYIDGIDLQGDVATHMSRAATGAGAGALASMVYVDTNAAAHLPHIRSLLPQTAGASLIAPDVLVQRLLATDSFDLHRCLLPILDHLTQNTLPASWRL